MVAHGIHAWAGVAFNYLAHEPARPRKDVGKGKPFEAGQVRAGLASARTRSGNDGRPQGHAPTTWYIYFLGTA